MNKKIMSIILVLCMMLSCLAVGGFTAQAGTTEKAEVSAQSSSVASGADYGLVDDVQQGQILQCWNWSYNGIKANMQKIAEQGFSAIQTSPIQTIKETTQNRQMQGSWWVYYQPSNFTIDTSSQNALGTKSEFKAMCDEAHKYGVKVIVDAVLNHMANNGDNTLSHTIPDDIRNDSNCWYSITRNTSNWESRWDITHNCMGGLPDLNTGNSKIQNYEKAFMKECIDAGADGFRFDGAKHIELPNDNENASSNFWTEILNYTTSYAKSTRGFTPYYYGEILDKPAGGQNIVNGYTSLMSVTANLVSDNIRNCVNSGDANGAKRSDFCYSDGSQPAASKAVLWNESHDTYANGSSRGISDTVMNKTWAIVGSRSEACGMYLARPRNYSDQIGTASVTAWGNAEVKAVNQFKNYFAGKSENLSSEGSIAYNERGTEGVVLVNCGGSSASVSVTAHKMASGTYTYQITGNTFTV
ncbi:MAG: alpha-amylase family glycosyl hydrolase, partial [Ruminococcus sp.]